MTGVQFEEIQALAGTSGRWQWIIFIVGSFSGFFNAFHHLGYVFLGDTPDHWCFVPNPNNWTVAELKSYAIPNETRNKENHYSQCEMYVRDYSQLMPFPGFNSTTLSNETGSSLKKVTCNDSWVYDHSEYISTIVSEWDLVCDRKHLLSTVQGTYMAGVFIGCLLYGMVSDRFGRRRAILVALVQFIVAGIVASFSVHYAMFIALRMILAMAAAGLFTCTFVLATEITDPVHRCLFGICFQIPFALGYMALPGIAYLIRDWKYLQLTIAIPNVLLVSYVWLLPESPRWLVIKGHFEAALAVLKIAAKTNKKTLPPDDEILLMMKAYRESEASLKTPDEKRKNSTVLDLFRRPAICRRILVVYFTWFVVAMVYYGLAFNVDNLGGNKYFITFLMAAVELPAYALVYFIIKKGGRRMGYCGTFLVGGTFCLLILAIPTDLHWAVATVAIMGKFCITATFAISYLFTAELFPTSVRNVAVNSSSMCGRVGSISAPYIVTFLAVHHRIIPLVLFGTLSVVAGVLALFLPETNKKNMMETWKSDKDTILKDLGTSVTTDSMSGNVSPASENEKTKL